MQLSTDSPTAAPEARSRVLAQSKEELMREFRNLVRDGEALLRTTSNMSGEALAQAREQFRDQLAKARTRVGTVSRVAIDRGRRAAVATDEYVHASPWPAIGAAAAVGLLIGVLISRR